MIAFDHLPNEVHWCPPTAGTARNGYWPLSPRKKAKIERDRREFDAIMRRLPNQRVGEHGGINEAGSAGRT